jgi:hypothetical protein
MKQTALLLPECPQPVVSAHAILQLETLVTQLCTADSSATNSAALLNASLDQVGLLATKSMADIHILAFHHPDLRQVITSVLSITIDLMDQAWDYRKTRPDCRYASKVILRSLEKLYQNCWNCWPGYFPHHLKVPDILLASYRKQGRIQYDQWIELSEKIPLLAIAMEAVAVLIKPGNKTCPSYHRTLYVNRLLENLRRWQEKNGDEQQLLHLLISMNLNTTALQRYCLDQMTVLMNNANEADPYLQLILLQKQFLFLPDNADWLPSPGGWLPDQPTIRESINTMLNDIKNFLSKNLSLPPATPKKEKALIHFTVSETAWIFRILVENGLSPDTSLFLDAISDSIRFGNKEEHSNNNFIAAAQPKNLTGKSKKKIYDYLYVCGQASLKLVVPNHK